MQAECQREPGISPIRDVYLRSQSYSLHKTCISTCSYAYGKCRSCCFSSFFSYPPGQQQGAAGAVAAAAAAAAAAEAPINILPRYISNGSSLLEFRSSATLLIIRSVYLRFLRPFIHSGGLKNRYPNQFGANQPHLTYNNNY